MKVCLTPEEIKERLSQAGINPTAQRIAICRYILCEADHPTADQVKAWADQNFPMVSRATVYNTLNTLVEAGLVKEVRIGDSTKVQFDANTKHHYHFYDETSGKLMDIDPAQVEVKTHLPKGVKLSEVEVVIKGKWK